MKIFPSATSLGTSAFWARDVAGKIYSLANDVRNVRNQLSNYQRGLARSQQMFGNELLRRQQELMRNLPIYTVFPNFREYAADSLTLPSSESSSVTVFSETFSLPYPCESVFVQSGPIDLALRISPYVDSRSVNVHTDILYNGQSDRQIETRGRLLLDQSDDDYPERELENSGTILHGGSSPILDVTVQGIIYGTSTWAGGRTVELNNANGKPTSVTFIMEPYQ